MWHFQKPIDNWTAMLQSGFPFVVKAIDRGDMLREAKGVNPNVITVLRHWFDTEQVFGGTWDENLARARHFFSTFIDGTFDEQYAPYVDYVEEWNEYLANSQSAMEVDERVLWVKAAAWVWKNEYRTQAKYAHIKLCLCNTAVGNIIDYRFGQVAMDYDCVLGYHPYTLWVNKERIDWEWDNLSGLFATMESALWPDYIKPRWLFTESGPFQACECGWRSSECLGGDVDAYVNAVLEWMRNVVATPAYQEGRVLGFALFNSGDPNGTWHSFETTYNEMEMLSPVIEATWVAQEPPAPPVDLEECLWDASVEEQVYQGIKLNTEAAIQREIFAAGLVPVHNEIAVNCDGTYYVVQAAEGLESGKRFVFVWSDGVVWSFGDAER